MLIVEPVATLVNSIISRIWPDKTEQQKQQLAAAMAADANLVQLLTGQMEVNKAEASNPNLFVAGWRPAVGWICAAAFGWQFVIMPVLAFMATMMNHPVPVPTFDISTMVTVLMGMLGIGGLRTYEKIKGIN